MGFPSRIASGDFLSFLALLKDLKCYTSRYPIHFPLWMIWEWYYCWWLHFLSLMNDLGNIPPSNLPSFQPTKITPTTHPCFTVDHWVVPTYRDVAIHFEATYRPFPGTSPHPVVLGCFIGITRIWLVQMPIICIYLNIAILLMEEILHYLGCKKNL